MSDTIQTKRCSKCKGEPKPITDFSPHKTTKDRYQSRCKQCNIHQTQLYRQQHRAEYLQQEKQYRKTHKAQRLQYAKLYYHTIQGHLRTVWRAMLQRCNDPKHRKYKNYGARGIKVEFTCFSDFFNYVVKELKADPRGLTIDRIDNDGHYQRGNIRFVSRAENNRNR